MDDDPNDIAREPPKAWVDALERGRADIAAGRTKPWSEVRTRFLVRIADMEAEKARRRA
jgi:predicted transcriptional regulator